MDSCTKRTKSRTYRNPTLSQKHTKYLNWFVIYIMTGLMAAAIAPTVTGALDIYHGHPKPNILAHWKAGATPMAVVRVLEVLWALFSLLPCQCWREAPRFRQGSLLLYGSLVALVFVGIRVTYALVAVCTQRRDLSPVYRTAAVRVVLMFLQGVVGFGYYRCRAFDQADAVQGIDMLVIYVSLGMI
ncbi:hypothetical protein BDV12DRAFT_65264 [Aspergillus spectabilis]